MCAAEMRATSDSTNEAAATEPMMIRLYWACFVKLTPVSQYVKSAWELTLLLHSGLSQIPPATSLNYCLPQFARVNH